MLREKQKLLDTVSNAISGIIIFATFFISYIIISNIYKRLNPFNDYFVAIIIFISIVLFSMFARGVSASKRFVSAIDILKEIFICYLFGALGFGLFTYAFKSPHFSRLYLLGGMIFSYIVVAIFYMAHTLVYKVIRLQGLNYRRVLLIGNEETLPEFILAIKTNRALGLHIIGILTMVETNKKNFIGCDYLGTVNNIKKILNSEIVDYVVFTVYKQNPEVVERAIAVCQERGIDVWFKPDFMEKIRLSEVDYLDDIPLFIFSVGAKNEFLLVIKRFFDIIISFILLFILSIPMLIIAVLVHRTTKGQALFRQKRMGLYGRKFIMFKFRTMYTDAQERKFEHSLKNEMKGPVFKMKDDPRVTKIGRFLRRYSLDELPQLLNVLIGDMSLVGPRPPLLTEVDLYKGWQRRRLSIRPGITCLWQVSGRNKIADFNEWVRLDLKYIDTWSLWLDFKILIKTIPTVLRGTGC